MTLNTAPKRLLPQFAGFAPVFAALLGHAQQFTPADAPPSFAGRQNANAAPGRVQIVTVNPAGSFSPPRVEIFSGDTVERHFASRTDTIIPVNLNGLGQPDCTTYQPYDPADPNEFTGRWRARCLASSR